MFGHSLAITSQLLSTISRPIRAGVIDLVRQDADVLVDAVEKMFGRLALVRKSTCAWKGCVRPVAGPATPARPGVSRRRFWRCSLTGGLSAWSGSASHWEVRRDFVRRRVQTSSRMRERRRSRAWRCRRRAGTSLVWVEYQSSCVGAGRIPHGTRAHAAVRLFGSPRMAWWQAAQPGRRGGTARNSPSTNCDVKRES